MPSRAPSRPPCSNDSSGAKPTSEEASLPSADEQPESAGRRAFLRGAGQLVLVGAVVEALALAGCGYRRGVDCGTCTRSCTDCTEGCTGCTSRVCINDRTSCVNSTAHLQRCSVECTGYTR